MEGFAAVSLAGNILQFIHTTRQLVSTSREIFDSGTKDGYVELELVATELRTRADRLVTPFKGLGTSADDDDSLASLANACKVVADQLLGVLAKLRLNDDSTKWRSFLQALKTQWHDLEIDALRERLDIIGRAVNARLHDDTMLQLGHAVSRLEKRNQELEISRGRGHDITALTEAFKKALIDTRGFEDDDHRMAEKMSNIASSGLHISAEQQILYNLRFVRLEDRYSLISAAHRNTLTWLFGTPNAQKQRVGATTFVQWLQSGDDLYWISGKPASGKSTLMKYLCTHELTMQHLREWAKSDEVIVAEYFFWNAGKNYLQKSQEGLLRSLLYQVLRKCPEFIRLVFPGVWQSLNPNDVERTGNVLLETELPHDVHGLLNALKLTCELLTQSDRRLCFFIDGLDEYNGNTLDVIELIRVLKALNHVKICVSSRQWNEFEQAYGKSGATKLYMQDFNDEDISSYITDVFAEDDNFRGMEDKETRGKALIEEIVTAANGVFLWVVLVVRSLQDDLCEGQSITRLQARLQELPKELENLFHRILFDDVKERFRDQAAQMFLVAQEAKETLPLIAYWFLDEPDLPTERRQPEFQDINSRVMVTKRRLIANCKGLLEPHFQARDIRLDALPSGILFQEKVDFLHRTVRDFLELPTTDIRQWLPPNFDPNEAICRALYSQIKTAPQGAEYGPHVSALYEIFDYHANICQQGTDQCVMILALRTELLRMVGEYSLEHDSEQASEDIDALPAASGSEDGHEASHIPAITEPKAKSSPISEIFERLSLSFKQGKSRLSRSKSRSARGMK